MISWAQFQQFPERPENGLRYELRDGEAVAVPIPPPSQVKLEARIKDLLRGAAGKSHVIVTNWPYRPLPDLQFWVAGIASIPIADWTAMPREEWQVYAPPMIIEALSPTNTPAKIARQKIVSLSAGTQEFWLVSRERQSVEVSRPDSIQTYGLGDSIPLPFGGSLSVAQIFA